MQPDTVVPDFLVHTPQGTWRIAGTRVSVDSVIHAFWQGATPEEICQDYPSLSLAQIYGAIAYYLNNQDKIDIYLRRTERESDTVQQELEDRHRDFLADIRRRLITTRQHPADS
jgi:uncharacterized protein (DUF433 family)